MGAGRLMVRADPAATAVRVVGVRAKLATDPRAVQAAAGASVESLDGRLRVRVSEPPGRGRSPQVLVELTVPEGTSVSAEVEEAEVVCIGRVGDLSARSVSGSVHAEHVAGRLDVRTGRGPVTVHLCQGPAEISVADAGVIVRACEAPLRVNGRSGDVDVWLSLGKATISLFGRSDIRPVWAVLIGVALIAIASHIPMLGPLVVVTVIIFGFGLAIMTGL